MRGKETDMVLNLVTLQQRKNFTYRLKKMLSTKFDLSDTQIFIFGSFLTDEFMPYESDIDIGVYSENTTKMYDIKYELGLYLDQIGLKHDIVMMQLHPQMWINIPIMIYGKQLTTYENPILLEYLLSMVEQWGTDPIQKLKVV